MEQMAPCSLHLKTFAEHSENGTFPRSFLHAKVRNRRYVIG